MANHAYPENEVFEKGNKLADKIAKKSPVSMKAAIELLNYAKTNEFYEGVKREAEYSGRYSCQMMEKKEFRLLLKKENPNLKGRITF